jgi:predicted site-specific integrase-resolvase
MTKKNSSSHENEKFLTRKELADRWRCSGETVKRRQRAGLLHPVYLSARKLIYRVTEIEILEAAGQ